MIPFSRKNGILIALIAFAFLVFCVRFDIRMLDVTNTEWLMHWSLDTGSYYLMENYYRQSAWHFPEIGLFTGYAYPTITAIGTNDIVSLFAVVTKIFSSILPQSFQYFGIWLLLCYFMQAFWSYHFLKTLSVYRCKNFSELEFFFASLFFITATPLLFRAGHPNMCMHAFFLAAFTNYFSFSTPQKKFYALWIIIGVATTIHLYTTAMLLLISLATTVDLFNRKKITFLQLTGANLISAGIVGVLLYLLGFFYLSFDTVQAEGFGNFSANLNTFFNSRGYSQIFSELKSSSFGQYEGFAYLGAGVFFILFFIFSNYIFIFFKKNSEKEFQKNNSEKNNSENFSEKKFKIDRPELYPILFVTGLFFIYALSLKIGWGDKLIYEYRLGGFTQKIFNGLRGSGRFIWPVFYLLLGFIFTSDFDFKKKSQQLRSIILIAAFLLQTYDTQKLYHLNEQKIYTCTGDCLHEKWLPIIAESDRVILYKPYGWSYVHGDDFYSFTHAAQILNKPITNGYCARPDEATQSKYKEKLYALFSAGNLGDNDKSIIISNPERNAELVPLAQNNSCKTFLYDGYLLTVPNGLTKTQKLLSQLPDCKPVKIERETIADFLNKYKTETIFCVTEEEASYKLNDATRKAFTDVGIDKMKNFGWCQTLMAVIHHGYAIFGDIQPEGVHDISFSQGQILSGYIFKTSVQLQATGNIQKEKAALKIDGKSVSETHRGINFVVLDAAGKVIKCVNFDTYETCERVLVY